MPENVSLLLMKRVCWCSYQPCNAQTGNHFAQIPFASLEVLKNLLLKEKFDILRTFAVRKNVFTVKD